MYIMHIIINFEVINVYVCLAISYIFIKSVLVYAQGQI